MDPVVGIVGILLAFKGAVDTALWIGSFFDDETASSGYLALSYHIEKTRLQRWGKFCKANDADKPWQCTLRDKPDEIKEIIVRILGQILQLNKKADALVEKHNINMATLPDLDIDDNLHTRGALARTLARISVIPTARFLWTLKRKKEFEDIVSKLQKLIGDLEKFSLDRDEPRLLEKTLSSHVLLSVDDPGLLKILYSPEGNFDRGLALSARAKSLLQPEDALLAPRLPSARTTQRLEFLAGSSTLGYLTGPDRSVHAVWVEWNTFNASSESRKYVERIDSLGQLLKQVSEPSLRLPPCHGVYEDFEYERDNGVKRIGYVFGLPQVQTQTLYDGNLRDHPPRTLSALIKDYRNTPIPSLGDRFQLACTLAQAFSLFHAAKWLHKGLHSGSIVFLERTDNRGITVTEPFITGFQYSRPLQAESFSQSPLEDKNLQHYYHPDADQGFSKKRDLYSLGVVLCEIGRWKMVVDVPKDKMQKLPVNREGWRKHMTEKVAPDLGWRMGTKYQTAVMKLLKSDLPDDEEGDLFFAQQYTENVLDLLSACKA
ncbi:hypothetical protein SLS55_008415 [Diplodia seriata]|uniref:Prion-inhibition and propagation HeLo domain-containing protein n=1 Tax=Diplodia seriata TaxID=420778 RepID=A0ABR3CCX2_9PEZI